MVHAVPVGATIAAGRIRAIRTTEAQAAAGVVQVLTPANVTALRRGPSGPVGPQVPPPLADERILHYGQYVAMAVAGTAEQAAAAAELVHVEYEQEEPVLDPHDPRARVEDDPWGSAVTRGDAAAAITAAPVRFDATYTTPTQTNNPLGLFTTVAAWQGDALTVYDSTQHPDNVRSALATAVQLPEQRVRVLAPYVGGGFGAGLRVWAHVYLAALAARTVGRPVKLVLSRPQMFTGVGHRPATRQRLRLGLTRDGALLGIDHDAMWPVAMDDAVWYRIGVRLAGAYACANLSTRDRSVRLNVPCPAYMRAPGTAEANFALESALDEIAQDLELDPIELRRRNYAADDPEAGLPWSSNALLDCYEVGADRFGWSRRTPRPGSMWDGRWLVGYGMAGVTFHRYQIPCRARATIDREGSAWLGSAGTDIGTGTYTVMTQLGTELLGLPMERVRFSLGDTDLPPAPQAGGSGLTMAMSAAVHAACRELLRAFLAVVADDPASPLRGCTVDDVTVAAGRIHRTGAPEQGESYAGILTRHGYGELSAEGEGAPPQATEDALAPAGAFGATFVEVRADPDLGLLRVARVLSVIDGGRILNRKLARGQIIGGVVGGIGMALLEETVTDRRTGRIANANLADYLVAVNADVPDVDVVFVGDRDRAGPAGVKGIGETGLVGVAAAVANAVHHATGKRIRSLPITIDKLL